MSWEMVNQIYSECAPAGHARQERFQRMMGSESNLRMKTPQGNRGGCDYWYSDTNSDARIMRSLQDPHVPLSGWDVARAQRQWGVIAESPDLTTRDKEQYRERLSELRDKDGHSVVRKNASFK